ncbi:bifunctional DNA primase/polymerase [Ruegeria lacuscaerulensis]|uniref:bifunctional DNA primase/polymerase n=1 Tax=Ruegeria lacuscaerulensis TaxID=55218 RepID=UPI00147F3953|nr:bifunctional DNA primase/polymerase [Ruegeria lacuscaerulensis]
MASSSGVFAQHAEAYAAAGLSAFPVDTRNKRPAITGWQNATPRRTRVWASVEKLGAANGLGILVGKSSGVTEIDVDGVGEAWLALAVKQFGETPVVIRTASGKAKLWYRHNGEGRHIRPIQGQPIDVLGKGFTIAPPSWREDLAASYEFCSGSIDDVANLPTIPATALEMVCGGVSGSVAAGERNDRLLRYCMSQARHCDDVAGLFDVAQTWASAFPTPLSTSEIYRCAKSAWGYETKGRNFLGLRKPQVTEGDRIMDELIDRPEALALFQVILRFHSNRTSFAIAPRAMSKAKNPPWDWRRIANARDILIERGFIEELSAPERGRRKSGQYRLSDKLHGSVHNHYTPSPL